MSELPVGMQQWPWPQTRSPLHGAGRQTPSQISASGQQVSPIGVVPAGQLQRCAFGSQTPAVAVAEADAAVRLAGGALLPGEGEGAAEEAAAESPQEEAAGGADRQGPRQVVEAPAVHARPPARTGAGGRDEDVGDRRRGRSSRVHRMSARAWGQRDRAGAPSFRAPVPECRVQRADLGPSRPHGLVVSPTTLIRPASAPAPLRPSRVCSAGRRENWGRRQGARQRGEVPGGIGRRGRMRHRGIIWGRQRERRGRRTRRWQ